MDGPTEDEKYEAAYVQFSLWQVQHMKQYLSKRGWSTSGTKELLHAKCVCAWTRKDPILPTEHQKMLQNEKDYQALLVTPTEVLTDPKILKEEWMGEQEGIRSWPPVYISDVGEFLMASHPDSQDLYERLMNEYKEGKAFRMSSTCNHVAGLLFRMEAAVRGGLTNPSKTTLPCWWNIPGGRTRGVKPQRIADINFEAKRYGKKGCRKLVSSEKVDYVPNANPVDPHVQRLKLLPILRKVVPNSCLFPQKKPKKIQIPQEASLSLRKVAENCNSVDEFMQKLPVFGPDKVQKIQEQTVHQSDSKLWNEVREGRLTASNFYSVLSSTNHIATAKALSSQRDLSELEPIKFGKAMEKLAEDQYPNELKKKHQNPQISKCGIYVHSDFSYLAASPDFLVHCTCCGHGLMECKGAYSQRDKDPNDELPSYLYRDGDAIKLKVKHRYFAQVQGQMAITKRQWCDFFVTTAHGHILIPLTLIQDIGKILSLNYVVSMLIILCLYF